MLSLQLLPATGGKMHPLRGSQVSSVHALASSQVFGSPLMHSPSTQASLSVHASPSSHGRVLKLCWQPRIGSQESSVQGVSSSQTSDAPDRHSPAKQTSPWVQMSPSSQLVPPGASASIHVPVLSSQNATTQLAKVPRMLVHSASERQAFVVPTASASTVPSVASSAAASAPPRPGLALPS